MKRRRISTRRQKRSVELPKPGRKGNIKVTREGWLNIARVALVEDGIEGVKVDRLAQRVKVSRGGFYYHFKNHQQVLEELLLVWKNQNRFTPARVDVSTPAAANQALDRIIDDLIHENGFDPQFDVAVREWARISHPVADVVLEMDKQRTDILTQVFQGMGYESQEARTRGRVFYWHQIGYYAVGMHETLAEREANLASYIKVLAGDRYSGKLAGRVKTSAPKKGA